MYVYVDSAVLERCSRKCASLWLESALKSGPAGGSSILNDAEPDDVQVGV
jgi:hypothetical protein